MPEVSIGLPVYNGATFLQAALDSILAQSFADFELVISDNASTDATEEICRSYAALDTRVRYVKRDVNRGAAWNFNSLVHETSAPFFKWAAHDDLLAPTCVERCLELLEAEGDRVVLAYPRTRFVDADGKAGEEWEDAVDLREPTPHGRLRALVQNLVLGNPMFGVVRRPALLRTRLNGAFPSSDYVLLAELALLGQIRQVPEVLFFRRRHPGMSRAANATAAELAEWFRPGAGSVRPREFSRLYVEHLRSIGRLSPGIAEAARCHAVFTNAWLRRNGVHMLDELFGVEYTGAGLVPFRVGRRGR